MTPEIALAFATVIVLGTACRGPALAVAGQTGPVSSATATSVREINLASKPTSTPVPEGDPVLVGAGDIASCNSSGDEATAKLLDGIAGTVFTVGDNAYDSGTADEFDECYGPSWGRFVDRTRPAAGNHDYGAPGAKGYFYYFGSAAGDPAKGYYSYDLGAWHIIVLNSNCMDIVGGCGQGSPQEQWLRSDLAAHPTQCTLAYWHHPLFGSSGQHIEVEDVQAFWHDLYQAGAEVVLNGHAHNYERLAPLDPSGAPDPDRGIREFIVGMGGSEHRPVSDLSPASEAHNDDTYGVLKLTLHENSYDWQFVAEAGKPFADAGSGTCH
jgi:hypothetical protein